MRRSADNGAVGGDRLILTRNLIVLRRHSDIVSVGGLSFLAIDFGSRGKIRPSGATMTSLNSIEEFADEQLLVREMAHRINNEYASAISLVSLTAARTNNEEVKLALAGVVDHLHSYARVHRALQMPLQIESVNASEYMRSLCQSISQSKLGHRGIELIYVESPVELSSERCWKLGMIVSELVTNAARHAFGEGGGTIWVELSTIGAFIECRVIDNGAVRGQIRPGQGTKIIGALARGLDGEVTQIFGPNGTTSTLVFPRRA
jgi:two-component sensor histidine kinase